MAASLDLDRQQRVGSDPSGPGGAVVRSDPDDVWRLSWRISLQPRPRSSATSAVPLVPVTGGAATYGPDRLQYGQYCEFEVRLRPTAHAALLYSGVAVAARICTGLAWCGSNHKIRRESAPQIVRRFAPNRAKCQKSPTVIREANRQNVGHKWARFGPWMGHKAKRQPCGWRSLRL